MKWERRIKAIRFVLAIAAVTLLLGRTAKLWALSKSAYDAQEVVLGWLSANSNPMGESLGQQVKGVVTYADVNGITLYYVVSLEPTGFVIVSPDNLIEPIIAFSDRGNFDASDDHPLCALVNRDLSQRLAHLKEHELYEEKHRSMYAASTQSSCQKKWDTLQRFSYDSPRPNEHLSEDDRVYGVDDLRVPPLTPSTWGQSLCSYVPRRACFNYYTPQAYWIDYPYTYGLKSTPGDADNFVAGCVAIALAQVMYYHQHPLEAVGIQEFEVELKLPLNDGSDVLKSETLTLRGGDGRGGPYQWDHMVAEPNYATTEAQRQAIGALCYDAGVAISMKYGAWSSGAWTLDTADALEETFLYTNAVKGCNVTYDSETQTWSWNNIGPDLTAMVNPNLDAGLPVILGIRRVGGGHAIVADGYGYQHATLYHHINIGWDGFDDAWYNLPEVDASNHTYTVVDECIYNIMPSGTGEIISGRVLDIFGAPVAGATVRADFSMEWEEPAGGHITIPMTIMETTNEKGIYAFVGVQSNTTFTLNASKPGYVFKKRAVTTGVSTDYEKQSGNIWGADFAAGPFSN